MATKPTFETKFRRRQEGKTDYAKRLELLKGKKPRLVVRGSNKNYLAQIVEYKPEGDCTVATALSNELVDYGWKAANSNLPAAYLTGFLCAKKGLKAGIKEASLDVGLTTTTAGSRCFAALKGAIDAGLKVNAGEKAFPPMERISGKHIAEYAAKMPEEKARKEFSKYYANGLDPKKLPEYFEKAKKQIEEKFK